MLSVVLRFWLPLLFTWIFALRRGGAPERVIATMFFVAAGLTIQVTRLPENRFGSVELGVGIVDFVLFVGLVAVAIRANRRWPMALAALQLVTLLGHFGKWIDPNLWRLGYALMIQAPAYPCIAILLIGIIRHRVRLRRYGVDRSWRT